MKLKLLWLLPILIGLGACAWLGEDHVPEEYAESPDKAAFLVGSIGVKTTGRYESLNGFSRVHFRKRGDDKIGTIVIYQETIFPFNYDTSGMDYVETDKKGEIFFLALKPGEYELFNVSFFYTNGYFENSSESKEEFSVPFSLEAGKVYYIGEFVAFGTTPGTGYFVHYDNYERDLPLLLEKHPDLRDKEMVQLGLRINLYPLMFSE